MVGSHGYSLNPFSLDRMANAVEKVRCRLIKAAEALAAAKVPYAIVGDSAVTIWVARVDEAAVRNTQDVDILLARPDFPAATAALEKVGFVYRHIAGMDAFLDSPTAKPRDAVHIIFSGEKVRPHEEVANPEVSESQAAGALRVLDLLPLVRIKLTAFRDKDRTHLRDLLDVGLIDASWLPRLPAPLAQRLQQLLDTPGS